MDTYLITYDLNTPGQNYAKLYESIKAIGEWAHPLESVWLVHTHKTAEQIYECLSTHIDGNDFLLIIETGQDHHGYLHKEIWKWLDAA